MMGSFEWEKFISRVYRTRHISYWCDMAIFDEKDNGQSSF